MNRSSIILATACALLVSAGARAQSAANAENEARHHYEVGTTLFNLGDFLKAADEYKLAYKARQDPVFLYNIAQAYRLGNDLNQALFFYRNFLRNVPKSPDRREVEDRIRRLEAQIAEQRTPPNETVPPGRLPSSGHAALKQESPPAPTPAPPSHATEIKAEPTPPPHATEIKTEPAHPATSVAVVVTSPAPAPEKRHDAPLYKKWWLWTTVGAVAAGAAVGIGLGFGLRPADPHFGTVGVF